jgi:crotonobetainyl-CoA:carnitine CoA-transferase CaiB-like acyl-CoA transferase
MGPDYPEVPGYDPALQAYLGYMDLTGEPQGPPTLMGVPMVDLKAGDELFAQTMLALAEQAESGRGKRIDISMARAAASWLQTTLPLLDLGARPEDVRRSGNEHREFVPVNVYRSADGWLYLAIGNDRQWNTLVTLPPFAALSRPGRDTNEGRKADRQAIREELSQAICARPTSELLPLLQREGLVATAINSIAEMRQAAGIAEHLTSTKLPDGREVKLPPAAVETAGKEFSMAPMYGEHTRLVLEQSGLGAAEIDDLFGRGVIH